MMLIVVETDSDAPTYNIQLQVTTVWFRLSLVALIINVDVSGTLFAAELLETVNMVEFTRNCCN